MAAWQDPYQGDLPKQYKEEFVRVNSTRAAGAYGNQAVIAQSSGFGKSRLMDEISRLVITIPTNLRLERKRVSVEKLSPAAYNFLI